MTRMSTVLFKPSNYVLPNLQLEWAGGPEQPLRMGGRERNKKTVVEKRLKQK